MRKLTTTALIALLATGCAEYLPLSSGALQGTISPLPQSLDRIAQDKIIQLETSVSEAYSVNLWVVEVAGDLHVFAGDNKTTWVKNIEKNIKCYSEFPNIYNIINQNLELSKEELESYNHLTYIELY